MGVTGGGAEVGGARAGATWFLVADNPVGLGTEWLSWIFCKREIIIRCYEVRFGHIIIYICS